MPEFDPFESGAIALDEPQAFDPFEQGGAIDFTKLRSEEPSRGGYLTEAALGLTQFVPASIKTASVLGENVMDRGRGALRVLGVKTTDSVPEARPLYRFGQDMQEKLEAAYPAVPEGERNIGHDVTRGLGQVASMVAGGLGARAAGATVKGAALVGTALGFVQEFDDAFGRSRQRGDDPDTALAKSLGYATVSALIENKLGAGRILRKYFPDPAEAAKKLSAWGISKATAISLAVGFGEEGSQRFAQNWIVEGEPSLEGVVQEGAPGGIVQAIAELPANLLRGRGGRIRSSLPRPERKPDEETARPIIPEVGEEAAVRQPQPDQEVLESQEGQPKKQLGLRSMAAGDTESQGPAAAPAQEETVAVTPQSIAAATGFTYAPAFSTEGMTPEQTAQMAEQPWHFTDQRPDSPTRSMSVSVPRGSTPEQLQAAIDAKLKEGFTPPVIPPSVENEQQGPAPVAGATPPAPAAPVPAGQTILEGSGTRRVSAGAVVLRPRLMQFKAHNLETGESSQGAIEGPWNELYAGKLLLWEPKNPAEHGMKAGEQYVVANGHHRVAAGLRQNVPGFDAQVLREIDGYTASDARRIAAESNIADGKGTIHDQIRFLRNVERPRTADEEVGARERIGKAGRQAADIAFNASDEVYNLLINEKISPEQAAVIANAAQKDALAQKVGARLALQNKLPGEIRARMEMERANVAAPGQTDMFSNPLFESTNADATAKKLVDIRRSLTQRIQTIRGAANRPEIAREENIDVRDPKALNARLAELENELVRWHGDWWLDAGLRAQLAQSDTPATPPTPPTAPVPPPVAPAAPAPAVPAGVNPEIKAQLDKWFADFVKYKRSKNVKMNFERESRRFVGFIAAQLSRRGATSWTELNDTDLQEWALSHSDEARTALGQQPLSMSSFNAYASYAREFLKYVMSQSDEFAAAHPRDISKSIWLEGRRRGEKEGRQIGGSDDYVSEDDIEKLLFPSQDNDAIGLRDDALLELYYSTGLRSEDVSRMEARQVDLENGWVRGVRISKTEDKGDFPIPESAVFALRRYLDSRKRRIAELSKRKTSLAVLKSKWLFPTSKADGSVGFMENTGTLKAIQKRAEKRGVKLVNGSLVTIHAMRRSLITHLRDQLKMSQADIDNVVPHAPGSVTEASYLNRGPNWEQDIGRKPGQLRHNQEFLKRQQQPPSPSIAPTTAGATLAPEEVQRAIAGERSYGFRVNVVSFDEASAMLDEQIGHELEGNAEAFFHDGQIWLIYDRVKAGRVVQAFREENAHGLLRTPEGKALLRDLLAQGHLQLTEAEKEALRTEGYERFNDAQLLDEFISKSARENRPWWKQAVDAIREFLSRFGLQLSNEETARLLLKNIQAKAQSSVDAEVTAIVAGEADIPLAAAPRNSIAALDRQINTLRSKQSFQGLNAQEEQRLRDLETQRGQMDLPGTEGALEPRFQLQGESRREVAPTQRPKQSDQFDLPLSVEPQPDGGPEVIRVPVQIAGSGPEEYTILGNDMLTAEMIARGEARAVELFQELRLPGQPDARVPGQRQRGSTDTNVVFRVDPGAAFPGGYETEGERLLETFIREATQQNQGGDAAYVAALGNAITKNFRLGNLNGVFSQDLIDRLIQATVSDRSFKAQLLRAATGLGDDISSIGRNLDFYLRRLMGDAFGGTEAREVIQRVLTNFRSWFTDAELNNFADAPASAEARQQLETMVSRLIALNVRDEGSRLYRRAQAALKPKFAKTLARLEADDRVQRAFEEILQQAEAQGFKPKKAVGKKKLSALESLLLMVSPETAVKLDAMIQKAVRDGELNAGMKYALAQATAQGGDAAAQELQGRFDAGEEPTQEQIEAGLTNPEYAHWQAIRDNLLNYEPITIKHAQDVLREDFKGTIFGEPVQRPADTRIDIASLAKQPDVEVARVLENFLQNVEANVDLSGASDETRLRVAGLITGQFEDQLQKARRRVIENFLVPPQRMPAATPKERLAQLLNARLARDPRFNSEPVRKLVQRVTQRFVDASIFDDLATQERDAKAAWIETTGTEVVDSISELAGLEATDPFRLFAEQVVFNELATKLQAAESRLVRRILDGPDVKLGTEPADPEKVVERLNKDRQRLEGAAHAGLLDSSMIDAIAQKSVTQKLLPTLNQMIQQALNTPIAREEDIFRNFADALVHDLGIDPALADKARVLMEKAYSLKFRKAREMALQRAIDAASPKELRTLKGRKAVWQIVERVVHTGGMDDGSVLAALAKYHKWNPLTDNLRARFKALVDAEDKLRELTPAERDKAGNDPLLLERAQRDKQAATEGDRVKIKKEMEALWSHLTRPMNLMTREGRSNIGAATMEFSAANLLTRTGFPFRQLQDILTQGVIHTPTRALAPVIQRYLDDRQRGLPTALWSDLNKSLWSAYRTWFSKWRESLASTVLALKGTQDARNVERLLSGIAAFDRLDLYATQLSEEGKHAQVFMARLIGLVKIGYRIAQAFDNLHGTPTEFQEMRQQAVDKLIANGLPYAAAHLRVDELMGVAKAEWLAALTTARQLRENNGLSTGSADVRGAAANIVKASAYQRMRESGLPADDFEEHGRMLRNTISWNERETGGIGGLAANLFREARGLSERVGFPASIVGSIFNFGNAIGITINRVLSFTPLGFFPSAFGVNKEAISGGIDAVHGSPWYRTRTDRTQRKIEATIGTGLGALAFALPLLGAIIVRNKWPRDKEERELWEKEGHRPGTIEIPVEGGFIPISMTSGPLVLLRPYLAAGGALVELFQSKDKAQEKLNQQAAMMGTAPGKVKPVDAVDVIGVVAQAAQAALIGGRTASGLIGAFTDYGIPNVKKIGANIVAPYIPGLPAFQELSRMAGTRIDAKMASFFDFLVPLPTSQAAAVNMLGDPVGTENDIQRRVQTLTGGTYPFVATGEAREAAGYRTLFETGYRPPSINSNRGYDINGETRPLNDAELLKYTKLRGQYFKEELTNLPPGSTKEAAKNAFETANARALSEVGVYAQPRASSPRAVQPLITSAPRSTRSSGRIRSSLGGGRTSRTRLTSMKVPKLKRGRVRGSMRRRGRIRTSSRRIRRPRIYA